MPRVYIFDYIPAVLCYCWKDPVQAMAVSPGNWNTFNSSLSIVLIFKLYSLTISVFLPWLGDFFGFCKKLDQIFKSFSVFKKYEKFQANYGKINFVFCLSKSLIIYSISNG
jgi:hypothetical protein